MKKLIVMLLVLGLVAAPVFAQKRQPQQVKVHLPKMYGEVELAEFDAAYQKYTDYVLFNKKAKSKKQVLQALSQMAAAYMNVKYVDRVEKRSGYFEGVWIVDGEKVVALKFLAKQGKLLPQEQQESYTKFLQQVELDIQTYRAMHPVANELMMVRGPVRTQVGEERIYKVIYKGPVKRGKMEKMFLNKEKVEDMLRTLQKRKK